MCSSRTTEVGDAEGERVRAERVRDRERRRQHRAHRDEQHDAHGALVRPAELASQA